MPQRVQRCWWGVRNDRVGGFRISAGNDVENGGRIQRWIWQADTICLKGFDDIVLAEVWFCSQTRFIYLFLFSNMLNWVARQLCRMTALVCDSRFRIHKLWISLFLDFSGQWYPLFLTFLSSLWFSCKRIWLPLKSQSDNISSWCTDHNREQWICEA